MKTHYAVLFLHMFKIFKKIFHNTREDKSNTVLSDKNIAKNKQYGSFVDVTDGCFGLVIRFPTMTSYTVSKSALIKPRDILNTYVLWLYCGYPPE